MIPRRDLVLFVGGVSKAGEEAVERYSAESGVPLTIAVLVDNKIHKSAMSRRSSHVVISCDTTSSEALETALVPFRQRLLAVTCRAEKHMAFYMRVLPHVPELNSPAVTSLRAASDKIQMRRCLYKKNRRLIPKFTVVQNAHQEAIEKIVTRVGFPLVIKPAGLAASLLVAECYHQEELTQTLRRVFRRINAVYRQFHRVDKPRVLVEQFMEGEMYSVDAYVTARGSVTFCPLVHIKTGKAVGFNDFFGYLQTTPVRLNKEAIGRAQLAARQAIKALNLFSTAVHIELMRYEHSWKVIEIGVRMGGFRHELYSLAFGIDHSYNDLLVRTGKRVQVPKKRKGYAAAMKLFAKREGTLAGIRGIKRIRELSSFQRLHIDKTVGDKCRFANNGGTAVARVILFHPDRSVLLADTRRIDKMTNIIIKK